MADYSSIYQKVIATLSDIAAVDPEQLDEKTELTRDLHLDSLALYEIIIELETYYELQISDEAIESLRTLDEVVRFIAKNLKTD